MSLHRSRQCLARTKTGSNVLRLRVRKSGVLVACKEAKVKVRKSGLATVGLEAWEEKDRDREHMDLEDTRDRRRREKPFCDVSGGFMLAR